MNCRKHQIAYDFEVKRRRRDGLGVFVFPDTGRGTVIVRFTGSL